MEYLPWSLSESILLGGISVLFLVQIIYLFTYRRIYSYSKRVQSRYHEEENIPPAYPPVSVVITAHNQAELLKNHIPEIMRQEYPEFQVVVVDNASDDETDNVLSALKLTYPNLYYTFIPKSTRNPGHKKLALAVGIKACIHEWIVFTEADCIPQSTHWLQRMASHFDATTEIILGYSRYEKGKGGFQEKVRLLNLFEQIRFLTFAIKGKPYMGYGRNLAYRKSLFFKRKGYSGYLNLARGEDDLFLNYAANSTNTQVEITPEANTQITLPTPRLWKFEQRQRKETYRLLKGSQPYFWQIEFVLRLSFLLSANALWIYSLCTQQWLLAGGALFLLILRFILFALTTRVLCHALGESPFKTLLLCFTGIQLVHALSSYKTKPHV